ncbi:hypothetical protein PEDI_31460 [Persicobacter diffluens]|uniref:Uncharacterized protein n=1 Tax=Persicobacter diffluens TaxID=981 RepID=A0AAN4VYX1_9BACT|nr:hypothetical protein PEDI_31460 [Persicobacter diffluens]
MYLFCCDIGLFAAIEGRGHNDFLFALNERYGHKKPECLALRLKVGSERV